jgi:hypothetical protein
LRRQAGAKGRTGNSTGIGNTLESAFHSDKAGIDGLVTMNTMHLVLVAEIFASTGCSDANPKAHEQADTPTDVNVYCNAACERIHECDGTRDQAACVRGCEKESAPAAPKLRAGYVTALKACVVAKDCFTLLSGGAVDACAAEVNATLPQSQEAVELCDAWEVTTARCGGSVSFDKGLCLATTKQYSDSALEEATACGGAECVAVDDCIRAALGLGSRDNSCPYANDGECDEPRFCPPGTDVADCGNQPADSGADLTAR